MARTLSIQASMADCLRVLAYIGTAMAARMATIRTANSASSRVKPLRLPRAKHAFFISRYLTYGDYWPVDSGRPRITALRPEFRRGLLAVGLLCSKLPSAVADIVKTPQKSCRSAQ